MAATRYPTSKDPFPYSRAVSIAQFICEDEGHSTMEAAEEFSLSQNTIENELTNLRNIAFSDCFKDNYDKQMRMRILYVSAKNTLKKVNSRKISEARRRTAYEEENEKF